MRDHLRVNVRLVPIHLTSFRNESSFLKHVLIPKSKLSIHFTNRVSALQVREIESIKQEGRAVLVSPNRSDG